MGKKAEAGTPKAIANAMKSKGLQRLRWYCQVCEKQCRDENAFKQHSLSEGHVRQMLVVGENASSYINQYSTDFQKDFLALLSRRWGTKRVRANQVYQEFIQDKHHSHMNATRWVTLSSFIQHLGRSGICHVDETEKGWFIAWIDNSPKALAKQDAALKKERQDMNDEERQRRLLQEQMERAKALEGQSQADPEAGPSGSEQQEQQVEEQDVDLSTMQPIKLSIGGLMNGKGKEREMAQVIDQDGKPSKPIETDGTADVDLPAVTMDMPDEERARSAEPAPSNGLIAVSAPAISAPKPKVNPFKLANKPNLLKSNPLKSSKPLHTESSSSTTTKRPISAVESIIQEEMEKKRKREQSTWSGTRGHGKEGLQRR